MKAFLPRTLRPSPASVIARRPCSDHACKSRKMVTRVHATWEKGPSYNKYRSRQEIENDYNRDWERTALLPDEILNRPMTVVTLLSCLPSWVRFCLFPGPIRFLLFRLSLRIGSILRVMHRQLVLQGAKLDAALARKASPPLTGLVTRVVLLRYHHKLSTIENIKFRLALLFGKTYIPPAKTSGARQTSRAKERLDPKEYDDLMLP